MAFDGVRAVQRCGGAEADHLPHSLSPTARPAVSHSMRNMCVVRRMVAGRKQSGGSGVSCGLHACGGLAVALACMLLSGS